MAQEKDFFSLAFSALMGKGSVDLPLCCYSRLFLAVSYSRPCRSGFRGRKSGLNGGHIFNTTVCVRTKAKLGVI